MGVTVGELVARLGVENTQFLTGLKQSEEAASQFQNSMIGWASALGQAAPFAALGTAAFKSGEMIDEAMDNIRLSTGQTGKALESAGQVFENVYRNTTKNATEVSTVMSSLMQRLQLSGSRLEELTNKYLKFASVAKTDAGNAVTQLTETFNRWQVSTDKQSASMDFLLKVYQRTGVEIMRTLGILNAFAPQLQEMGLGFDKAAVMVAKMEQGGVSTTRVLMGMNSAFKQFANAGKEPAAELQKLLDRIRELSKTNPSEALALAGKYFPGRGANLEVVKALKEGRLEVEQDLAAINKSGETVEQALKDVADWDKAWGKFLHNLQLALAPLGTPMFELLNTLVTVLKPVITVIEAASKLFAMLPQPIQVAVIAVTGLAASWGLITKAVTAFISPWSTMFKTIVDFVSPAKAAAAATASFSAATTGATTASTASAAAMGAEAAAVSAVSRAATKTTVTTTAATAAISQSAIAAGAATTAYSAMAASMALVARNYAASQALLSGGTATGAAVATPSFNNAIVPASVFTAANASTSAFQSLLGVLTKVAAVLAPFAAGWATYTAAMQAGTSHITATVAALSTFSFTLGALIPAVGNFAKAIVVDVIAALMQFATVTIPAAIAATVRFATTAIPAATAALANFARVGVGAAGAGMASFITSTIPAMMAGLGGLAAGAIPAIIAGLSTMAVVVGTIAVAWGAWKLGAWVGQATGLNDWIDRTIPALGKLLDMIASIPSWVINKLEGTDKKVQEANKAAEENVRKLEEGLRKLGVSTTQGSRGLEEYSAYLRQLVRDLQKAQDQSNKGIANPINVDKALESIKYTDLKKAVDDATKSYRDLKAAKEQGIKSSEGEVVTSSMVYAAFQNMKKATEDYNKAFSYTLQMFEKMGVVPVGKLKENLAEMEGGLKTLDIAWQHASATYDKAAENLAKVQDQYNKHQATTTQLEAAKKKLAAAEGALAEAAGNYEQVLRKVLEKEIELDKILGTTETWDNRTAAWEKSVNAIIASVEKQRASFEQLQKTHLEDEANTVRLAEAYKKVQQAYSEGAATLEDVNVARNELILAQTKEIQSAADVEKAQRKLIETEKTLADAGRALAGQGFIDPKIWREKMREIEMMNLTSKKTFDELTKSMGNTSEQMLGLNNNLQKMADVFKDNPVFSGKAGWNPLKSESLRDFEELAKAIESLGNKSSMAIKKSREQLEIELEELKKGQESGLVSARDVMLKQKELLEAIAESYRTNMQKVPKEVERALEKIEKRLDQHKNKWTDVLQQVSTVFTDFGKNIADKLWNWGSDNEGLKKQEEQLRKDLADRTAAYEQHVADVKAKIAELTAAFEEQNQKEQQEYEAKLAEEEKSYADFVADVESKRQDARRKNYDDMSKQTADVRNGLQKQRQEYERYAQDVGQKLQDIARKHKDAIEKEVADLRNELHKAEFDYKEFMIEAQQSFEDINKNHQQQAADEVADVRASLNEQEAEYRDFVAEMQESGEAGTEDGQKQLSQRARDMQRYREQASVEIYRIEQRHAEAAAREAEELKRSIEKRKREWQEYQEEIAARNRAIYEEHAKEMAAEEQDLARSLAERKQQLQDYELDAAAQIARITEEHAKALAEEEKALNDSLTKRLEEHKKYEQELTAELLKSREDRAKQLATDVNALQKELETEKTALDQYTKETQTKLNELKEQYKGFFKEVLSMFESFGEELGKMFTRIVTEAIGKKLFDLVKNQFNDLLDWVWNGLKGLFGGVSSAVSGLLSGGSQAGIGVLGSSIPNMANIGLPAGIPGPSGLPSGVPTGGGTGIPTGVGGGGLGSGWGFNPGTMNVVTGAVQAFVETWSLLATRRMEQDIGRIEVTSREIKAELMNFRDDSWTREGHLFNKLDDIWSCLRDGLEGLRLRFDWMLAWQEQIARILSGGKISISTTTTTPQGEEVPVPKPINIDVLSFSQAISLLSHDLLVQLVPMANYLKDLDIYLKENLPKWFKEQLDETKIMSQRVQDLLDWNKGVHWKDILFGGLGGGNGLGGIGSALGGILGGITSPFGALISGIGSLFGAGGGSSKDTGRIEVTTREIKAEVQNLREDEWTREGHLFQKLDDIWNTIIEFRQYIPIMEEGYWSFLWLKLDDMWLTSQKILEAILFGGTKIKGTPENLLETVSEVLQKSEQPSGGSEESTYETVPPETPAETVATPEAPPVETVQEETVQREMFSGSRMRKSVGSGTNKYLVTDEQISATVAEATASSVKSAMDTFTETLNRYREVQDAAGWDKRYTEMTPADMLGWQKQWLEQKGLNLPLAKQATTEDIFQMFKDMPKNLPLVFWKRNEETNALEDVTPDIIKQINYAITDGVNKFDELGKVLSTFGLSVNQFGRVIDSATGNMLTWGQAQEQARKGTELTKAQIDDLNAALDQFNWNSHAGEAASDYDQALARALNLQKSATQDQTEATQANTNATRANTQATDTTSAQNTTVNVPGGSTGNQSLDQAYSDLADAFKRLDNFGVVTNQYASSVADSAAKIRGAMANFGYGAISFGGSYQEQQYAEWVKYVDEWRKTQSSVSGQMTMGPTDLFYDPWVNWQPENYDSYPYPSSQMSMVEDAEVGGAAGDMRPRYWYGGAWHRELPATPTGTYRSDYNPDSPTADVYTREENPEAWRQKYGEPGQGRAGGWADAMQVPEGMVPWWYRQPESPSSNRDAQRPGTPVTSKGGNSTVTLNVNVNNADAKKVAAQIVTELSRLGYNFR